MIIFISFCNINASSNFKEKSNKSSNFKKTKSFK